MTKSRTCHTQKMSTELATPKLTRVGDSAIFWGWQVLDLVISEVGLFRTLFYSGFWHIGKFGGGKKDQPPCIWTNLVPFGAVWSIMDEFRRNWTYWEGDFFLS